MKNKELEQKLEQLEKLKKEVADGILKGSSIKPGDVIEFGLNMLVGVLESKVVFLGDGKPEINLVCCEFTKTTFLGESLSRNITVYNLSGLGENVKVIGKFTFEKSDTNIIKLLTMTINRK